MKIEPSLPLSPRFQRVHFFRQRLDLRLLILHDLREHRDDALVHAPLPICNGLVGVPVPMPTVRREGAYRFYFHSHEPNEPAHVHVDRENSSAKFWLEPVGLAGNFGFSSHEVGRILALVREHQQELLEAWHGYFGSGRG